ncbi:MAG: arylsulfatase, partial [Verrucomicrobiales bacterium]
EKNGVHRAGGPFRGGKYSVLEGGTRTPFITRWKDRIQPAVVTNPVVCTIDMAASFAGMAGIELPADACLDSHNLLGALLGEGDTQGRVHLIQQDNGQAGNFGYRVGKWKLQRHDKKSARNVVVQDTLANTKVPRYRLFDLAE